MGLGTLELAGRSRIACGDSKVTLLRGGAILRLSGESRPLRIGGGPRCEPIQTALVPTTLILRSGPTPTVLIHQGTVFGTGRSYRAGTALRWRWTPSGAKPIVMRSWPRWSAPWSKRGAELVNDGVYEPALSYGIPMACEALLRRRGIPEVAFNAALTALVDLQAHSELARIERWRPAWPQLQLVRAARQWLRYQSLGGHAPLSAQLPPRGFQIPPRRGSLSPVQLEAIERSALVGHAPPPLEAVVGALDRLKRVALDDLADALPRAGDEDAQWIFAVLMELGNDADQWHALRHASWDCLRRCLAHVRRAAFHSSCSKVQVTARRYLGVLGVLQSEGAGPPLDRPLARSQLPQGVLRAWHHAVAAGSLGQDEALRVLIQSALNGEGPEDGAQLFNALLNEGLSVWDLEAFLQFGAPPGKVLDRCLGGASFLRGASAISRRFSGSDEGHASLRARWRHWLQARQHAVQRLRVAEQLQVNPWPLSAVMRVGGFTAFDILLNRAQRGDQAAQRMMIRHLSGDPVVPTGSMEAAKAWRLAATLETTWLPEGADFTSVQEGLLW